MVTNYETEGQSIEFSPKFSVGELSCSTGKSSTALHYPYLSASKPWILCQPFCRASPQKAPNCFGKKLGEVRRKFGLTLGRCIADLAMMTCPLLVLKEGLPRVFSPRKAPPTVKSMFRREIMQRRGRVRKVRERIPFVVYV